MRLTIECERARDCRNRLAHLDADAIEVSEDDARWATHLAVRAIRAITSFLDWNSADST